MIYVFAHKRFDDSLVRDKEGYKVLWVNPEEECPDDAYDCDRDYADNIADRNSRYSELTGVYHIWKNCTAENVTGLCQYSYYFSRNCRIPFFRDKKNQKNVIEYSALLALLEKYDMILPPCSLCMEWDHGLTFSNRTVKEQYCASHYAADLDKTEEVLGRLHPEYLDAWHTVMNSKTICFRNMMVTGKKI